MKYFAVGIDFDGTLVEHEFPDIGKPVPFAFDWLKMFQKAGARLILWTMRSDGRSGEGKENGPVLSEAAEFCRKNGVEFWGVNVNPTQRSWTSSPKAYCHVFVDDANACCPLIPSSKPGGRPMVDWSTVGPAVYQQIVEALK